MRKNRQRRSQSLIEQNLLGSIRDVIRATNDVRHSHIDIVRYDTQVICRPAIASQQHKVFNSECANSIRPRNRVIQTT